MEASGYHLNLKKRRNRERRSKSEAYERLMMLRSRIKEASRLENVVDEEERKEDHEIASFRSYWERCYADCYGSFEDTTVLPPMRYTFGLIPEYALPDNGVQIFSVKIAEVKEEEGLHWPLQVYGLIAVRDSIDPRRNLLFHCQILTQEDPFLLLTGPSRAVVLIDPIMFEVQLKAMGKTESEDKLLNFGVLNSKHACCYLGHPPHIVARSLTCNRSKLEFSFAVLAESVEATIRVEVVHGSWPLDIRGRVVICTTSIGHGDIVLLDSLDAGMPISLSGVIGLSRRAVSVELSGELEVDLVASQIGGKNVVAKGQVIFTPKEAGMSVDTCDLGFCKLGITVAWSLLAPMELDRSV